jgi:hypothetical protein
MKASACAAVNAIKLIWERLFLPALYARKERLQFKPLEHQFATMKAPLESPLKAVMPPKSFLDARLYNYIVPGNWFY